MKQILFFCGAALVATGCAHFAAPPPLERGAADRLIDAGSNSTFAYERLGTLCDTFGPRFSGSTNLESALNWILAAMKRDGLENVRGEEVMVPHWVRGAESAEMLLPRPHRLPMLGLGGSIATPPEGVTAEALVVKSFADLKEHAAEASGKIVVFNAPFVNYGDTVEYRVHGAVEAARVGAVASLVRSITPFSIQSPHTGAMDYSSTVPKIPNAAITVEDAEMMQRMQDRGQKIVVRLRMSAMNLPDAPSRNVVAEVTGSEKPEEIVIVSGHIDSWDVGQGAMDDGGGAVAAWEALRLMHNLGLRPRRTVRVVLWVNEENGLAGARAYEQRHKNELPRHVLAIESDRGTFQPLGFSFVGSDAGRREVEKLAAPLARIGANKIFSEGSEADVGQLERDGVPTLALVDDGRRYFWYHHTEADTLDKLDPGQLAACATAMAVMAWEAANAPVPIPRASAKP
ncbi:MAG TPA: M28 family metallopeptidase [Candidatus Baltobacteraceae bacterium]|jgi:carboxypeptidase Q|nr:M28 family metallopeptidase [Candidatus Baltobacteraceae bacterium]